MAQNGRLRISILLLFFISIAGCGQSDSKRPAQKNVTQKQESRKIERPDFSKDSAYAFIEKQVAFGPRVPNTEAHKEAGNYLSKKLKSYGFHIIEQETQVTAFDGKKLNIKNIIGEYLPERNNRILLFAHWDTRPFADHDTENKSEPIDGANDGGSGVGVLLEVARQIEITQPDFGIDIIFFDAEDYGKPMGSMSRQKSTSSWCLGSQYWASNPHKLNYNANYGILLDMVGGKDAIFPKEAISMYYAPQVVNKVWKIAKALNHGNHFVSQEAQFVGEDDHLYVNKIARIPSIDLIEYNPQTGGFNETWHTHDDNIENIDKETLQAVGETVMAVILEEGK